MKDFIGHETDFFLARVDTFLVTVVMNPMVILIGLR